VPQSTQNLPSETFAIPFSPTQGEIVTYTNGHRLVIVPKAGEVFNLNTWVATGSIHETEADNGVSHFLEHLMFKGTTNAAPGEFDHAMESMGAIINAATWKDFTFYYITGPNADPAAFAKALEMHADMLTNSTLPPEEIGPEYDPADPTYAGEKRERSVVIEEIGMREDQPMTKLYNAVNKLMYNDGHPYQRDVIGLRHTIGTIPRTAIEAYYRRWYSPNQCVTLVVGEFDREYLIEAVAKAFSFPEPEALAPALQHYTEPPAPASFLKQHGQPPELPVIVKGDFETTFFMMGYHGPEVSDLKASIALDIISYTLTEGRASRLTQTLIEQAKKPNFNALGSGQYTFKLGNVFFIQGNFTSANVEASLLEVRKELYDLLNDNPLTAAELARAKKKLKTQFAENVETASGLGDLIGESLTVAGDLRPFTDYLPTLASLTLAEVQAVANTYLALDKAYTSVLVPTTHDAPLVAA
jgi:zinc protease